jgi:hypothetical protein
VPLGFAVLPVSTVLVFDLGVYLCVWGALGGYALALLDSDEAPDPLRALDRGGTDDGMGEGVGHDLGDDPGDGARAPAPGSAAAAPDGGPR